MGACIHVYLLYQQWCPPFKNRFFHDPYSPFLSEKFSNPCLIFTGIFPLLRFSSSWIILNNFQNKSHIGIHNPQQLSRRPSLWAFCSVGDARYSWKAFPHRRSFLFSSDWYIILKNVLPLPSKYKILKNDIIRSKLIDLKFLHTLGCVGRVQYVLYIFSCIR